MSAGVKQAKGWRHLFPFDEAKRKASLIGERSFSWTLTPHERRAGGLEKRTGSAVDLVDDFLQTIKGGSREGWGFNGCTFKGPNKTRLNAEHICFLWFDVDGPNESAALLPFISFKRWAAFVYGSKNDGIIKIVEDRPDKPEQMRGKLVVLLSRDCTVDEAEKVESYIVQELAAAGHMPDSYGKGKDSGKAGWPRLKGIEGSPAWMDFNPGAPLDVDKVLQEQAENSPEEFKGLRFPASVGTPPTGQDTILFDSVQISARAHQVVDYLQENNQLNTPGKGIFEGPGGLVYLKVNRVSGMKIHGLEVARIKTLVNTRVRMEKKTSDCGFKLMAGLPNDVAEHISIDGNAMAEWPPLEHIICRPVFDKSGALIGSSRYVESIRAYVNLDDWGTVPEIPESPTKEHLKKAKTLLLDDLLGEFAFDDVASKANALGLALVPLVRFMIDGPTPFHMVTAPTQGTGKTYLVDLCAIAGTGRSVTSITAPTDEAEWRKVLFSAMREQSPTLCVDNIKKNLDSSTLDSVLTKLTHQDRVLGGNQMGSANNIQAWSGTANNPTITADASRRFLMIRLDAGKSIEQLSGRSFKRPSGWATANREDLLWALAVLVKHWVAKGKPAGGKDWAGFDAYAKIIGGILSTANIKGFMDNIGDSYQAAITPQNEDWIDFLCTWLKEGNGAPMKAGQLAALAIYPNGNTYGGERAKTLLPFITADPKKAPSKMGFALKDRAFNLFDLVSREGVSGSYRLEREAKGGGHGTLYHLRLMP